MLLSIFRAQAVHSEERKQLLSNTDTRGSSAEEQDPVLSQRQPRRSRGKSGSVDETREHNCASTLNIVVEYTIAVPENVKVFECVVCAEIFELNQEFWESGSFSAQ